MTNTQSSKRRKHKEPDKFDGVSIDFRDYIVQFEQIAQWNDWTLLEMAQQLKMCLSVEARKMLGHLDYQKLTNYHALKDVLIKRVCPPERKSAYATEFYSRVRKPNEPIDDFGDALRRLWYLAFPGESSSDVHVIKAFTNGLNDFDMKKHISLSHPETLEAAIGVAIEYEAVVSSFGKPLPGNVDSQKVQAVKQSLKFPPTTSTHSSEIEALTKTMKECFSDLSKEIRKGPHMEPTCYNCGELGHISPRCPYSEQFYHPRERQVSFQDSKRSPKKQPNGRGCT